MPLILAFDLTAGCYQEVREDLFFAFTALCDSEDRAHEVKGKMDIDLLQSVFGSLSHLYFN